jgi:hypothetical protein
MHAQKAVKAGKPIRRNEEALLLQRWASSDSERSMDDLDSDDSSDRASDMHSAGFGSGCERFDA